MFPKRFVLKRLLLLVPVLIGVATLVFSILHLARAIRRLRSPGSGQVRSSLSASAPISGSTTRSGSNISTSSVTSRGSTSGSYVINRNTSVREVLSDTLPVTLELALYGQLFGILFGIPLGVLSAVKQDTLTDHTTRVGALAGISVPIFWSGPLLILLFAQVLGVLPTSGRISSVYNVGAIRVTGMVTIDTLLAGDWDMFWSAVRHMPPRRSSIGVYSMAHLADDALVDAGGR